MILKDITFSSPEDNILFDEALLVSSDKGTDGEFLRFWESPEIFIVLGRIGKEQDDIDLVSTRKDKIPILRRTSGGGTVVQGPGCLNYAFVLSKNTNPALFDLRQSYQWIADKVIQALKNLGVEATFHPISDIALASNQKKFSGNAQHRGKNYILHHGTILYDFDLSLISRYLKMPKDIPEYRRGRPHQDFVTNITVDPAQFKHALKNVMSVSAEESFVVPSDQAMITSLKSKYQIQVDVYH